jgi:hypothetical protein
MKFRHFTDDARKLLVERGFDKRVGEPAIKRSMERSWHLAKADGSDVITSDHLLRAFAEEAL